jgi:hypothetical protein
MLNIQINKNNLYHPLFMPLKELYQHLVKLGQIIPILYELIHTP